MKFKETYRSDDDPNLSLGRFYNTDIRKLVSLRQDYPLLFSDDMGDPQLYFTERVQSDSAIFFTMKYRKKVVGYGAFDPIGKELATMHCWKRRWERTKKHHLVGLARLLILFGFRELNLRRITMTATDSAKTAISMIQNIGFTQEGLIRKFGLYNSVPTDILVFGMLKEEF